MVLFFTMLKEGYEVSTPSTLYIQLNYQRIFKEISKIRKQIVYLPKFSTINQGNSNRKSHMRF